MTSRRRALHPDVEAAARQRLLLPGLERRAVHAVRDPIVFPGEVVTPLAIEPAVGAELLPSRMRRSPTLSVKRRVSRGGEVGLEDQFVERAVVVQCRSPGSARSAPVFSSRTWTVRRSSTASACFRAPAVSVIVSAGRSSASVLTTVTTLRRWASASPAVRSGRARRRRRRARPDHVVPHFFFGK